MKLAERLLPLHILCLKFLANPFLRSTLFAWLVLGRQRVHLHIKGFSFYYFQVRQVFLLNKVAG